jgi:hypothetical protein
MSPDEQDSRPIDPAAFTAEERERLIRFFRILDEWDRESTSQDNSRVESAPMRLGISR